MTTQEKIAGGLTSLGIEFGSTRIKAVLIDDSYTPIAIGTYDWENKLENGYWTYSQADIIAGLQGCYKSLAEDVRAQYGTELNTIGSMGISAMMHGYMAFGPEDNLLVPFRTWRNTTTAQAAEELSAALGFNMPQRWSISHLYQAVLGGEQHLSQLYRINTLAGYVHYLLTGDFVLGAGDASGMFPISADGKDYDAAMLAKTEGLLKNHGFDKPLRDILPAVRQAGDKCGSLTAKGAQIIDPTGTLKAGVPFCPPEGDAGTGMVATNSVLPGTGNISAGTSIFSMLVLKQPLKGYYPEIDVVTTPDGRAVAMVHCNNCCSELDAWVKLFGEFSGLSGASLSKSELYEKLYRHALTGDSNCGGIVAYNFLSGEPVAGAEQGRPMVFRSAQSSFTLANFIRAQLYSAMAALKLGMDILTEKENVPVDCLTGHGGLFKVQGVAQQFMANAMKAPVSLMKTAGEGGAWGMALLAAYMRSGDGSSLAEFLENSVFAGMERSIISPDGGAEGFDRFMDNYKAGLPAQYAAAAAECRA